MNFGRGFYAVLDRDDEALARTLAAHASVLQVRCKPADAIDVVRIAAMARRVCDEAGCLLVVNDRIDIAFAVGADGVHLGQADVPIADARRIAAGRLFFGVSTHDRAQVERAVGEGADYLGYGPVFATRTKANPDPVQGIAALAVACKAAGSVPIVAIGGVSGRFSRDLYAAGASALCAISAVNDAGDVGAAARSLWKDSGANFAPIDSSER